MPELGKYVIPVLGAYGVSLGLLALLIWQTLARNARLRRELQRREITRKEGQNG
ncbi:heme exporter protein CcmD [Paracoccus pacificus]|uniref:Heme exporter protein D n=1 Tax=Paracoccus pacificus TaxID=1463598 RepID=A0ABW4R6V0_9RHOB